MRYNRAGMARQRLIRLGAGIAASAVLWLGGQWLGRAALAQRDSWPGVAARVTLPSPETAALFWLGYREMGASLTWCRALVYYGGAQADEADYRYLTQLIDNVIALDPWFKPIYRWAAYAITFQERSPTQDEFRLSVKYLEEGMARYPDEYELFWLAGLRYWLDIGDKDPAVVQRYREKGANYIELAMQKPDAPADLATLAAYFRSKLGQKQRAIDDLKQRIMMTTNEQAKERMLRHLHALTDETVAQQARESAAAFHTEWKRNHPTLPASLYLQLGPRPPELIDFDALATERDLFGAGEESGSEL